MLVRLQLFYLVKLMEISAYPHVMKIFLIYHQWDIALLVVQIILTYKMIFVLINVKGWNLSHFKVNVLQNVQMIKCYNTKLINILNIHV